MNRRRVFSGFSKVLSEDDIIFCIGKELISESKFGDFEGVCYFDDLSIDYFALALGISIGSKKRIFVFCEDNYLIRYINSMVQISVSGCTNFYLIVLKTGSYTNELKIPSLSKSIRSIKGTLFNLGILVHDYSIYFDNIQSINKLKGILNKSLGPLTALIVIDNKRLYGKDLQIDSNLNLVRDFILKKVIEDKN